jgi:cell division protein FtsB
MSTHRTVREPAVELTGVRRWLQQMYGHRRRFATVAAAVLALAMGYHVVFGQNGLTAYEKKKQDAKALAQQLQALQDENDA